MIINMMLLSVLCIVVSYFMGSINGAIIVSNLVYHEDIRTKGSGNAGFTNFSRTYGMNKNTVLMFLIDVLKALVPTLVFSIVFGKYGMGVFNFQFGASLSSFFCIIGHCFPIYYRFKGGKAFLAFASTFWFVDWRVGLIALGIFFVVILVSKYMSLASMFTTFSCSVILLFFKPVNYFVCALSFASAFIVIFRHKENIIRLINGAEPKFSLHK